MSRLYVVTFRRPVERTSADRVSFIVTGNTRNSAARTARHRLADRFGGGEWDLADIRPATPADRAAWEKANT